MGNEDSWEQTDGKASGTGTRNTVCLMVCRISQRVRKEPLLSFAYENRQGPLS
jgi:hypothetical protein